MFQLKIVGLPTLTAHVNYLYFFSSSAIVSSWASLFFSNSTTPARNIGSLHQFMEKMNVHHFEDRFPISPFQSTLGRSASFSESVSPSQSPSSSDNSTLFTENGELGIAGKNQKMKKLDRKGTSFAYRVREHVKMGPKFSDTVKGKLSVGAKIIKKRGRENIFRDIFGVSDGEKLLKASQCYLSTTAGPIAGILFISTQKVSFCSERSIAVHSSSEGLIRIPYKVSIPVEKIKAANESGNVNNPSHKYIEIVTEDDFEFWFMGFVRYEKAVISLQSAISMSEVDQNYLSTSA